MGWPKALGANIADPCFADKYVEKYLQGRVKAVEDIYEAGLSNCIWANWNPLRFERI
jgi:hypothetical protein